MKHLFSTMFCLLLAITSQGQVLAVGECDKKDGIDAEAVAFERAKESALNEVFGQTISTSTVYRIHDDEEEFYRNSHIQKTGVVFVLDKQVEETRKKVTVTILADVHSAEMPKTFDVHSLKKRQYTEDVPLEFSINSYGTNYINAFWFDEETGDGGLLFMTVLTKGQERDFSNYDCWKTIFPELLTKDERERLYFRDMKTYVPPKQRVGGKKYIKVVFIATPDPLAPPVSVTDELSFEQWWVEIPRNQRQQPVVEHLTFLM